ncbi:hypothetical protein NBRC116494_20450 [Aurantivibrio plasticivorans]
MKNTSISTCLVTYLAPLLRPAILFLLSVTPLSSVGSGMQHQSLPLDPALSISDVFNSARQRAIEQPILTAQQQRADNFTDLGKRWTNGSPSVDAIYWQDKMLDDIGLEEWEAGVTFDLWRWKERSASQSLASHYQALTQDWRDFIDWNLRGQVNQTLLALSHAEALLSFQKMAVDDAERLVSASKQLYQAGSISQLQLMQAQSVLAGQQSLLLEHEAAMVDAEREYQILTGLDRRPHQSISAIDLNLSDQEIENHVHNNVTLKLYRAELEVAEAKFNKAKLAAAPSPQMRLGVRKQQSTYQDDTITSVGLSFSLPIASSRYIRTVTSEVEIEIANAKVALHQQEREMQRLMHELEHSLYVNQQALAIMASQVAALEQQKLMALTAFDAGETNLAETLYTLQHVHTTERDALLLQEKRRMLLVQFNHLLGL